jgi:hypothetical protein
MIWAITYCLIVGLTYYGWCWLEERYDHLRPDSVAVGLGSIVWPIGLPMLIARLLIASQTMALREKAVADKQRRLELARAENQLDYELRRLDR